MDGDFIGTSEDEGIHHIGQEGDTVDALFTVGMLRKTVEGGGVLRF